MEGGPEQSHAAAVYAYMTTLWQDLRYAVRVAGKHRVFTTVAIASLALGIGANATIFTLVNGLLLRPPAVSDPAGLVEIWQHDPRRGSGIGSHMQLSFPDYARYRDHHRSFSEVGGFTAETSRVIWNRGGDGDALQGAMVSANFFQILGLRPALGRAFLPDEDREGDGAPVVVLSHAAWRQRFGSDASVIGTTLNLNGRAFIVVGVAPAGFTGLLAGFTPEFWTPLAMHAVLSPGVDPDERHQHWLLGVGRLKPGVTRTQAQSDLEALGRQLSREFPDADGNLLPAALPVELVPSPFRGMIGGAGGLLMAVVALVLLIACANVANLMLAKAAGRRREMALRAALGASRRRLLRQVLTETVLITGIAGLLGLLLSLRAAPLLLALKPASVPITLDPSPDVRVLVFTLVVSLFTGLAFGLVPALHQSRLDQANDLKDGSPQGSSPRSRLRNALVVSQVAGCVVLLVGAGLCLRSLLNARSIDPGFVPRGAVTAALNVESFGYGEAQGREFYARLLERLRALPGVRYAALTDHLPLGSIMRMEPVEIDGYQPPSGPRGGPGVPIDDALVSPGYFEAMGTPIVRGRGFLESDRPGARSVIVINEEMASRFWPGQDPVGRFVTLPGAGGARTRAEIVGVTRTGRYQSLGEAPRPFFYKPLLQTYEAGVQLVVRTADDRPILGAIRDEVRRGDPRLALIGAGTLDQHMELPLFPARAAGGMLGLFGAVALLLAVMGLYGVVAYSVSLRTREMGVRMALGARRMDVMRLVVWQGLRLTLIGLGIGLPAALGASRALSSVLYGISTADPLSFAGVALLLMLVAAVASSVPARWATRVDPIRALRAE